MDPTKSRRWSITINQLFQGNDLVGAWSLKVRPTARDRPQLTGYGPQRTLLQGSGGWEGAPGSSTSWYKGRISGKNLADVLKGWGFAPSVTSQEFHRMSTGRWPGSPAWLASKRRTLDAQ